MNKILINNGNIDTEDIFEIVEVKDNEIVIKKNAELELIIAQEQDIDLTIRLLPNIKVSIFETQKSSNCHIRYHYELMDDAILRIEKISEAINLRETTNCNLNKCASLDYLFSVISDSKLETSVYVYHLKENTKSNVICHGISISDSSLNFEITGNIPKGSKNSILNQESRIISKRKEFCQIKPILLIEESEVEARHASVIGTFNEEEIFYLMSRGIDYKTSIKLLLKSFLLNHMRVDRTEQILTLINEKWR